MLRVCLLSQILAVRYLGSGADTSSLASSQSAFELINKNRTPHSLSFALCFHTQCSVFTSLGKSRTAIVKGMRAKLRAITEGEAL